MRLFKNIIITSLVLALIILNAAEVSAYTIIDSPLNEGINYLKSIQNKDGGFPVKEGRESDVSTTTWVIMALAAVEEDLDSSKWTPNDQNPVDYLLNADNQLKETTEYARILLSLSAANKQPVYKGQNLVDSILSFQKDNGHFGQTKLGEDTMINSHIWSILALASAQENISKTKEAKEWLISSQNKDGGFGWYVGGESDSDDTAVAIQALIILGEHPKASPTIKKALEFIKTRQSSDGGLSSSDMMGSESNSASDSWVLTALAAAGENIEDEFWKENDKNIRDHLISTQKTNGSFMWKEDVESQPVKMTAYGVTALSGKSYPININYEKIIENIKIFSDISYSHWAYEEILELVNNEIISGYPDGTFKPKGNVTREEFTSMIIKGLKMENRYFSKNLSFADLKKESWSYKYISIAYGNSIIKGRSEDIFDPKGEITGAELATMLVNTLPDEEKGNFSEGEKWYSKNIKIAKYHNLLYPGFDPEKKSTRAECAYSILKIKEMNK